MDRFVERCAGLDVHKDSVAATVRVPGSGRERLQETRTFQTTTRGLLTLADWLSSYGVHSRIACKAGRARRRTHRAR